MTAFCLIINRLRCHLSFVTFAMYSYSEENAAYQASHFLSIETPELSRKKSWILNALPNGVECSKSMIFLCMVLHPIMHGLNPKPKNAYNKASSSAIFVATL